MTCSDVGIVGAGAVEDWFHQLLRPLAKHLASKAPGGQNPCLVQLLTLQQVRAGFENADELAKCVLDFLLEAQAGKTTESCIIQGAQQAYADAAAAAGSDTMASPTEKSQARPSRIPSLVFVYAQGSSGAVATVSFCMARPREDSQT